MVLDQEHGDAILAQLADSAVEVVDFLGVHTRCRLVEQQQDGLGSKSTGEFEPPLLAECQIGCQFITLVRKIEKLERPVDLLPRAVRAAKPAAEKILVALLAGILRDPKILPNRQLSEQAYILERACNSKRHTPIRRQPTDVRTLEDAAPSGRA